MQSFRHPQNIHCCIGTDKLFNEQHVMRTITTENYEKVFYYNDEIDQRGLMVFNHVSSKEGNFYLTDINT